jgi:hypothetical protein
LTQRLLQRRQAPDVKMVSGRTARVRRCKLELDINLTLPDRDTTNAARSSSAFSTPSSSGQRVRQVSGVDQCTRFCLQNAVGVRLNPIARVRDMAFSVTVLSSCTSHH